MSDSSALNATGLPDTAAVLARHTPDDALGTGVRVGRGVLGLALLVVLDALTPAERLAFVLHDLFAVPFDQIAEILGRSPHAANMLASRARRRVQTAVPPNPDVARQREIGESRRK